MQWSTGDAASATWEDKEELYSRFPAAPAWGQAGFQGGGDVRVPSTTTSHDQELGDTELSTANRPKRQKKLNPRYAGGEWAK